MPGDQEPKIIKNPEQGPEILSFEEFSSWGATPRYNNFLACFSSGFAGEVYQQKAHYKRFSSEYPEKAASLLKKVKDIGSQKTSTALKAINGELYEAYKIMRGYGVSDKDLFS